MDIYFKFRMLKTIKLEDIVLKSCFISVISIIDYEEKVQYETVGLEWNETTTALSVVHYKHLTTSMNLGPSTIPPPSIMDLPLSYIHMSCLKLQRTASYLNSGRDNLNSLGIMVIS